MNFRGQQGYSLVELLVVMAILGVLSSVVFPIAKMSVQREREQQLRRALWELRDAIDAYRKTIDRGGVIDMPGGSGYPPDLKTLVQGVVTAKSGGRVYFLRRIPRDPFADPNVPAEQTWGLRSYLSSADDPKPGVDIFDVYSRSPLMGLNGVPLRQW
jgi:general secretion pathway protein G